MTEQRELDYHVVDVFTDSPFAGNPLAVVVGADAVPTEAMQRLAQEFHLSETAFPLRPSAAEAARGVDYRLRIFTPASELPFAGHPSVGTAWVLADLGRVPPGRVVQACGVGDVALAVSPGGGPVELTGGPPTDLGQVDPEPLLAAVGLSGSDLDDAGGAAARVCGTGLPFGVLPVRPDALAACVPDLSRLRAASTTIGGAGGVFVASWDPVAAVARARMFAADLGGGEDPATGSAALAYGVFLVASGLLRVSTGYTVRQGVEMGRPATLRCRVDVGSGRVLAAHVAGDVAAVARGRVRVPDG
jgi:trans-2,3-dihydro-3-hydroxyanthranilate isomerase